ncbi:murein biosynthesis integral membrane protein MurJ [Xylanimonas ulmi]|uniref:Putative peptidoglycan lipid II flippase n=1 Tax=Xylanimonas ulmi TaxID=228973 RepID=A0A4Q7M020_9MICO|nr:lipid II flippase MurJ [Xylanibacterium ulmi]RZS61066.1 putative peptidoglycan lipid II flippase [Xylanibacterium ulmi]
MPAPGDHPPRHARPHGADPRPARRVGYPRDTTPAPPTELIPAVGSRPTPPPRVPVADRTGRPQPAATATAAGATASPSAAERTAGPAAGSDATTARAAVPTTANLGRNSLILTIGTFASRLSGQVRNIMLIWAIGATGLVANAFDIANNVPNMLFALLTAGVLQAVLMPQIMHAIKSDNTQERLDKLLTAATSALVVGTAALVAASPLLVRLFTLSGEWPPAARALAVSFAFWCIPQVLFYGLFSVLSEVLNARGQFAATGLAPMANNVVSVIGFGAFIAIWGRAGGELNDLAAWTTAQTVVLSATATLGIAAQTAVLLVALRRGGFHWRLRFGVRGIGLRSAGKVVGWTIAAVGLEQAGLVVLKNITSAAGAAAAPGEIVAGNAMFTQALTIYLLPHSLVVVSIITALFPRMSLAAAERDLDGVRSAMSTGLRTAGIFSVISTAVMMTVPGPLLKTLLPTIAPSQVAAGAPVLRWLAAGLVALGATVMVKRMYFAFEDGRSIFVIQIFATGAMVVTLLIGAQSLDPRYWTVAAAGAYALSTWVSVLLRVAGMRRLLHGVDGARVLRLYVRAGLAAGVAAAVGWATARALGGDGTLTWAHAFGVTAAVGTLMLLVYAAGLKALRVREFDDALRPLRRRLGR